MEEEASWVCMCRALTGCIVFLSEEEQRRRAYKALQGTFALLHDHSRYTTQPDWEERKGGVRIRQGDTKLVKREQGP